MKNRNFNPINEGYTGGSSSKAPDTINAIKSAVVKPEKKTVKIGSSITNKKK